MSSDCANRIDQWQEFGFEERFETTKREIELAESIGFNSFRLILEFEVWDKEHDGFMKRLDRYLACMYEHGITAMIVLANDCSVPKSLYKPPVMGPQRYDIGYHGGRKASPHRAYDGYDERWHILDDPDTALKYQEFVREIITTYAHDPRVIVWNIFNEPGNGRGAKCVPHMEKFFEGHEADLEKIFTIKADVVTKAVGEFTGDDGTKSLVPGNFMGAFVTQPTTGEGENSWNDLYDFGEAEWTSEWGSYELTMRPGIKDGATFVNSTEPQYVSLMRWGIPNQADFYIADLRFEDEDGNVIACANFGK